MFTDFPLQSLPESVFPCDPAIVQQHELELQQAAEFPIRDDEDDLEFDPCLVKPLAIASKRPQGFVVPRSPATPCPRVSDASASSETQADEEREPGSFKEVTVVKLSGQVVFGPQELECGMTIKGLKALFESGRPKSFALDTRLLDDSETLVDLPSPVVLGVAYTEALAFGEEGDDEVEEVLKESYVVWESLPNDYFGDMYKASRIGREPLQFVAIKKIRMEENGIPATALRQISSLRNCSHPNIIGLQDVLCGSSNLYLVMEHVDLDMRSYLKAFGALTNVDRLRSVSHMCFQALHHCHLHGIMHRDVNPRNILIDAGTMQVKLSGFPLSRQFTLPLRPYTTEVITLWYRPPEILLRQSIYGPSVDIWSMACVVLEMAAARPLFHGDSEIHTIFEIFRFLGTPTELSWPGVTKLTHFKSTFPQWKAGYIEAKLSDMAPVLQGDGAQLLTSCLQYDGTRRPTGRQCVHHKFFDGLPLAK